MMQNIMSTLIVRDMVKFLWVAANVVVRSENSLQLTTHQRPIQFLAASLPSSIHPFLEVSWDTYFHILNDRYINTKYQINFNGIMAELGDVHQSLFPPFKHCPKCSQEHPMRPSSLFGYLCDVDGCHTIEHFSLYCQREPFNFNMRWTRTDGSTVFSMVNLYNSAFMGDHTPPLYTPQQSFLPQMSVEVCKDGMDINTLVFDYASRGKVLMVPSSGLDCVGYNETKKQLVRAVVTDGLTIGHWRCSASAAQLETLAKESRHPAPGDLMALVEEHWIQFDIIIVVSISLFWKFNVEVQVPDQGFYTQLFLPDTFPTSIPQVILYDSACKLLAHIYNIVAVDVFHFKSHKEDDCFCRQWTDPNLYPQLKKDRSWIFNSSAAEIANIWYGGFASICCNKTTVQFNFFLDEMVRLHNIWLCEKLSQRPNVVHIRTITF
ncbi:hypothetical protein MJO29_000358 [Puccinia striiformis f. sp. tritici]|nr:hypothetical protein MJO29_000358 [Puccinia striiformis f. sp. tritici]